MKRKNKLWNKYSKEQRKKNNVSIWYKFRLIMFSLLASREKKI